MILPGVGEQETWQVHGGPPSRPPPGRPPGRPPGGNPAGNSAGNSAGNLPGNLAETRGSLAGNLGFWPCMCEGTWRKPGVALPLVKFVRYDPFQAKFRRVMAVPGKSPSANTANAKGQTSGLLMDIVSFLELFVYAFVKK